MYVSKNNILLHLKKQADNYSYKVKVDGRCESGREDSNMARMK